MFGQGLNFGGIAASGGGGISYLVIAGGGSGGPNGALAQNSYGSAGGGAGGYLHSYLEELSGENSATLTPIEPVSGTTYTITVGGGGAGAITTRNNGQNSLI